MLRGGEQPGCGQVSVISHGVYGGGEGGTRRSGGPMLRGGEQPGCGQVRGVFQFYPESINIFTKVEDRIKYVLKDFFL